MKADAHVSNAHGAINGGIMRKMGHAAWLMLIAPVLAAQAVYARATVPRLPGASGPAEGVFQGRGPTIRLLVLGESTVAGVGVETMDQALACQCARRLRGMTGRAVHWRAVGMCGASARDLLARVRSLASLEADLAILVLGVNDVVQFRPAGKWAADLAALVSALREITGDIPVLLAGVPPMEWFPALPRPLRGFFGQRAKLLDNEARLLASRMARLGHCPTPLPGQALLACDGFHPGPDGHAGWAMLLACGLAALAGLGPDDLVAELAAVAYDPFDTGRERAA